MRDVYIRCIPHFAFYETCVCAHACNHQCHFSLASQILSSVSVQFFKTLSIAYCIKSRFNNLFQHFRCRLPPCCALANAYRNGANHVRLETLEREREVLFSFNTRLESSSVTAKRKTGEERGYTWQLFHFCTLFYVTHKDGSFVAVCRLTTTATKNPILL